MNTRAGERAEVATGLVGSAGRSVQTRPRLTRQQILAFRRRVGALDERMPEGSESLRRAAWAGLQDSMPRAALLSLHARVDGVDSSTWEDPSLAQLWGPRYSTYVVPKRDFALFSLGRHPDNIKRRLRAERIAEQLHAHLDGARMTDGEVGRALGVNPNTFRYAATTGTVAIRWEGARAPTVWTIAAAEVDPADACLELARRYLHIFGPTTADGFARWAGISRRAAAIAFASLEGSLLAVRTPLGEEWLLADDEPAIRAAETAPAPARLLPSGDSYFLLDGARAGASHPAGGSAGAALDAPRVARRAPRRRRDPRNLATGAAHRANRRLESPLAWDARCDRGRGRRSSASRRRPTYRGGLEHMSRASPSIAPMLEQRQTSRGGVWLLAATRRTRPRRLAPCRESRSPRRAPRW